MNRVRKLLWLGALGGIAVLAVRAGMNLAGDIGHYNRLRAMSNEGPLWDELPKMVASILRHEKGTPADLAGVAAGLPADAARYIKIETM